jgi:hypothetical protein
MVENITGFIDLQTCASVVAKSMNDYVIPLGIVALIGWIALLGIAILYIYLNQEMNLRKDFLRRQGLLNKFEDWKKDRKLGD